MKPQTRNYNEHEVVKSLNKKNDVFVNDKTNNVFVLSSSGKGDIGIKAKGKIDFLRNYCKYWKIMVSPSEFAKAKKDY